MNHSRLARLLLPLGLLLPGCGDGPAEPRLDEILPSLSRCLTPASAERELGPPDEITGSGLLIYGYRLQGGRTLWLSFPGYRPIAGAALEEPDGARSALPLGEC